LQRLHRDSGQQQQPTQLLLFLLRLLLPLLQPLLLLLLLQFKVTAPVSLAASTACHVFVVASAPTLASAAYD